MSPCGIAAILVMQLTSPKFWHMCHFCSFELGSGKLGPCSVTDKSKCGPRPAFLHLALMRCCNSSRVSPPPSWAFCARTVGKTHFNHKGSTCSMTPTSSISSIFLFQYWHCSGVSEHWWTLVLNFASFGMLSWCTTPGTWVTSPTARVKQSANSWMRSLAFALLSSVRFGPNVTISSTTCTHAGLNVSMWHVYSDSFASKPWGLPLPNVAVLGNFIIHHCPPMSWVFKVVAIATAFHCNCYCTHLTLFSLHCLSLPPFAKFATSVLLVVLFIVSMVFASHVIHSGLYCLMSSARLTPATFAMWA